MARGREWSACRRSRWAGHIAGSDPLYVEWNCCSGRRLRRLVRRAGRSGDRVHPLGELPELPRLSQIAKRGSLIPAGKTRPPPRQGRSRDAGMAVEQARGALPARLAATAATAAATAATVAAATAAARRLRPSLIDGQPAAAERAIVQLRHGSLRVLIGGHFDEGEAACATRLAVPHDVHRFDGTSLGKERLQVVFVGFVGKVADVKLTTHQTGLLHPNLRDALAYASN